MTAWCTLQINDLTDGLLTRRTLSQQNRHYRGSGGVSEENRTSGFVPAFLDGETGMMYRACFADGRLAPLHILDGLPAHLVVTRDDNGKVRAVKSCVIAGFMRGERFYTREQAARALRLAERIHACRQH